MKYEASNNADSPPVSSRIAKGRILSDDEDEELSKRQSRSKAPIKARLSDDDLRAMMDVDDCSCFLFFELSEDLTNMLLSRSDSCLFVTAEAVESSHPPAS